MAKQTQDEAPVASRAASAVRYARFYQPVQFIGHAQGVHLDTSKLRGAAMAYDQVGLRVDFGGRTVVIGWPNIVYVELS